MRLKIKKEKYNSHNFFSQRISLKVLVPIYLLLGLVTVMSLVNFWFIAKVYRQYDIETSYLNTGLFKKDDDKIQQETVSLVSEFPNSSWWSFGDLFSSDAYLDLERTDMFPDYNSTSLSFTPLFLVKKDRSCISSSCGLNEIIVFSSREEKGCIGDNCLLVSGVNLKFNGLNIALPTELTSLDIKSTSISTLQKKWVVSFIVSDGGDEKVFSYFFNGKEFSSLTNNASPLILKTKFGLGGGFVSAGGLDNDFLLTYFGYESHVFHFKRGAFIDISDKFGIKVSDNGFKSEIIRIEKDGNIGWYITSLTEGKFKLIKLWQNETDSIVGSIELTDLVKEKIPGKVVSLFLSNSNINFVSQLENNYTIYSFEDKGFDNSHDYLVTSKDINSSQKSVLAVLIKEILITPDKVEFYFSDNNKDFVESHLGEVTQFSGLGSNLLWQFKFLKSNNVNYSPWFGGINYLDYLVR
jgi:hypothetical protein